MKKLGLYSLLVAGLLFTAGCANKEVDADNTVSSEDSNASSKSVNNQAAEGALLEKADGGNYYNINGERTFIEHVYFDYDKFTLSNANKDKAVSNASKLAKVKSETIVVYGNADERGSDEYNYALGLKRANAVKNILVSNGVKANITIKSLGESNPVCTEATESCYSKNRRVEQELAK
ncbi:Peptidoglycan-associated lipoprotein precursor [Aliarcobacter thereius]|uniref:Peptidoglycan-associated lipoprotein n=2 Tax=Aliarcobacter thereius TaxID=544718 RepID=A0A1C0B7P2_9BACT|nr:OmpA family protein [Aliarcobacter thereius]OCL87838.1 Peptidoglycan-associated lipoprotein precursor [Aliarcobacter thereius]OCL94094.1 Peptidoglycan-associated lipoprotein precursor [Aliarcobacter thereius]OCL95488.1 Peptidoglycan-associated lipoprotein precursor [Aliarcobacter thereius LMG 24486]OCL99610.1 Peptidoglycan-associated lipoprotein precursor [Aliarcobacter thereius]QBF16525.1 Tol-Pal system peptidoglycan-associated lipoprotein [Aliarcobacter thereius LMG 24486]